MGQLISIFITQEQKPKDEFLEEIDIEAASLQITKRNLQIHYLSRHLHNVIGEITQHVDHHPDCHERNNVAALEHVFNYYWDLLAQTTDDDESFCGDPKCSHSTSGKFETKGIFFMPCIYSIIFDLLSRFQNSIDKNLKCHDAENNWEKTIDKQTAEKSLLMDTIYWRLKLSVPLACCQEDIPATYQLHPRRLYDRV